jgi:chemotaxis protein methyltransferase CheR
MTSLTHKQFEKFRDLIYQYSSIFLTEKRKSFLESKLSDRIQALNLPSYDAYYQILVENRSTQKELPRLIEAVVIHETSFFRIRGHFVELERKILPELITQKWQESKSQRSFSKPEINIWSVACSTGEEPYSIAMSLLEVIQEPAKWKIKILATDISNLALSVAQQGSYSEDKIKKIESRYLQRYFMKEGSSYKVEDCIRKLIRFKYINLAGLNHVHHKHYNLIFCRNVLIYFDRKAQNIVMEGITQLLLPGGYLFLGDAEPLHIFSGIAKKFEFVETEDAMIYRKK